MTIAEKLQFIADRMKDGKEFYIGGEEATYRFRNSQLRYLGIEKTDDYSLLTLNYFLSSPLKLKPQWEFTEDERAILRNLPNEFQWIARDKTCDGLFVYALKPTKSSLEWDNSEYGIGDVKNLNIFKHLFQSIRWSDDEPCEFRKYL